MEHSTRSIIFLSFFLSFVLYLSLSLYLFVCFTSTNWFRTVASKFHDLSCREHEHHCCSNIQKPNLSSSKICLPALQMMEPRWCLQCLQPCWHFLWSRNPAHHWSMNYSLQAQVTSQSFTHARLSTKRSLFHGNFKHAPCRNTTTLVYALLLVRSESCAELDQKKPTALIILQSHECVKPTCWLTAEHDTQLSHAYIFM